MQPQRDCVTADDIPEPEEGKHSHQSSAEQGDAEQAQKELQKRRFTRKRARRTPPFIMDDDNTMVPSNLYQSWLQDTTNVWGRRPKIGGRVSPKTSMKLSKLIELPPVALSCGLVGKDLSIHYLPPLLQFWIRSIQPQHDSPSGKSTSPRAPAPSSSSSQEQTLSRQQFQDPPEFPMAGFGNGDPTERLRNIQMNLNEGPAPEFNLSTERKASGSAGTEIRSLSVPSPGPGLDYISNTSVRNSGQFGKTWPSSSRFLGSGVGPVDEEEEQWIHERGENNLSLVSEQQRQNFKIPRFSLHGPTPDQEFLIETGIMTLPKKQRADFWYVGPSIDISAKHTTMGFQQNGYFEMRLDTIDELTESYVESLKEKKRNNQHQADADNVTLDNNLESFQAGPISFNRYERFDIEGDEETQFYFPSQEYPQKPSTPLHPPPPEMQPQRATRLLYGDEFSNGAGVIQPLKAIHVGLVYEETHEAFDRYLRGTRDPCDLYLPSFASCFSPSHASTTRSFKWVLTCVGKEKASHKSKIDIFTKSLDPDIFLEVQPQSLEFTGEGHCLAYVLNARVLASIDGHVSASLTWYAPGCVDIVCPIIFYADHSFVGADVEINEIMEEKRKRKTRQRNRLKQQKRNQPSSSQHR